MDASSKDNFKAGYVAIVGKPNVGKSTFLNNVINFKVSAISPKPQTTRHKILGILTGEDFQMLFLDTPGIMKEPRHELDKWLLKRAFEAIDDADVVVMLAEPEMPEEIDIRIVEKIKESKKPAILLINKVDTVNKSSILPIIDEFAKTETFKEIIPVSVLKHINVDIALNSIKELLPYSPPFYPKDAITDKTERFLVQEILREKLFYLYGEEIPYASAVEIDIFKEKDENHGGKDYIRAVIHVEKDNQKKIIIGKEGNKIKKLGTIARQEIEYILGRPVYLELWVKVSENWRKKPGFIRDAGY
ncbi:MAG TPA: GTPase Era [Candidatus Hydrothermia bacterium]|nr:GTPase Era [Candidatus Hydrothermia bacterium]